ncbi:hypothetical protein ACFY93_22490 [Streptomyces sp. NPDC008313]|uniref:hypothetical protein n=1 Tax=Streptomyces sp. NPDC008313 TaxID=3364826 RepID=UPI0036EA091A
MTHSSALAPNDRPEQSATADGTPRASSPPGRLPALLARRPALAVDVRVRAALAALTLFAAARIVGAGVLALVARAADKHPLALLGHSWDSVWYLAIAADGYGRTLHYRPWLTNSDLAFFPLYPGLVRAAGAVLPVSGGTAALLVSWLATAVAACGVYAVGARLHGRAVGTALVVLWGLLPHSIVLTMAYTEPVLAAFAAWSLYAVLSGRWLWAGALAACAGLSRPNGFAVAAAVLLTAAYEAARRRGKVTHRLWTGAALAPLGWGGYVLWVGHLKGDLLGGYFTVQRGWGSRFDFGAGSLDFARQVLLHGGRAVFPLAMLLVALAVLLFALLIADRAPLPLVAYCGVLLVVALGGSGYFECKPRFLLPAFPLLLPPARALVRTARARPWHAVLVVGALAGLSFGYGAYLVVLNHTPL